MCIAMCGFYSSLAAASFRLMSCVAFSARKPDSQRRDSFWLSQSASPRPHVSNVIAWFTSSQYRTQSARSLARLTWQSSRPRLSYRVFCRAPVRRLTFSVRDSYFHSQSIMTLKKIIVRISILLVTVFALDILYFNTIPRQTCPETTVRHTKFGLYSCAGDDEETHSEGCVKIAGFKYYLLTRQLTNEECRGSLLDESEKNHPDSF